MCACGLEPGQRKLSRPHRSSGPHVNLWFSGILSFIPDANMSTSDPDPSKNSLQLIRSRLCLMFFIFYDSKATY